MNDHPNKHIREAVDHGWRLRKAGPRAHIWGLLFCPPRSPGWMPLVGPFHSASS